MNKTANKIEQLSLQFAEIGPEIIKHLISEAKSLREDNKKLKMGMKSLYGNMEHLVDVIDQVEQFSIMNEDEKVAELINLRENLKMVEELCGFGGESCGEEDLL